METPIYATPAFWLVPFFKLFNSVLLFCLLFSSIAGARQHVFFISEPKFVNLLRSPGIDSEPSGLVKQPYLTYWPARLHRLSESIPWNRFFGSIPVLHKRSQIRALFNYCPQCLGVHICMVIRNHFVYY
jgi:hypothetical protein